MPLDILIADDSDAVRMAVRNYLTERNFNVCGDAIDGEDAIEKVDIKRRCVKEDCITLYLVPPSKSGRDERGRESLCE